MSELGGENGYWCQYGTAKQTQTSEFSGEMAIGIGIGICKFGLRQSVGELVRICWGISQGIGWEISWEGGGVYLLGKLRRLSSGL